MSLGAVCGPLWQCISHLAKNGEKLCIWDIICNKLCCYKNRVFESARSWRNSIVLKFPYDFLFSSEPLQADEKHLNRAGRWVACRVSGSYSVWLFVCCFRYINTFSLVWSFLFQASRSSRTRTSTSSRATRPWSARRWRSSTRRSCKSTRTAGSPGRASTWWWKSATQVECC